MKIYRPLWEDGAFLAPQQFQQQARWDAHVADTVARMALAHPWGVLCAEFDEGALALSRLNATRLCVRFADGTLVDTDLADNLPPVCDLSAAGSDAVDVLLCLPLLSANGGNLDEGQDSARPRRWQSERVTVQELAGHERSELTVLRHALTLRLGTHATDVNGQVLLRLSTDNPEEVRGWLPGGDLHADLMALLHVWLGAHLDVRMQLCVARHLLPDARLSCNAEQTAQVGRTAVLRPLNAQQNRNDIITIHLGRFQRVRENIQRRKNDEDGDYRW